MHSWTCHLLSSGVLLPEENSLKNSRVLNRARQRMHLKSNNRSTFCESQARRSLAKSELGSTVPRKMGLNWFMPALANSRVGSLWGTTLLEGTAVWPLPWKNSMKVDRTLFAAQDQRHSISSL